MSLKITEVFREIVAAVSAEVTADITAAETQALGLPSKITGVHYEHGHLLEIIETLQQKGKAKDFVFKKYPVVCLIEDIRERHGQELGTEVQTPGITLLIVHQSMNTYKAEDRKQKVFYPVLYPIYEALMQGIVNHSLIKQYDVAVLQYDKYDRLYWGRFLNVANEKNIFNDWIDAIEINNLNLSFDNC